MPAVRINLEDLIIFEGIAKNGKNVGKAYKFVKIDRRLSNNGTFVDQLKAAGVRSSTPKTDTPSSGVNAIIE